VSECQVLFCTHLVCLTFNVINVWYHIVFPKLINLFKAERERERERCEYLCDRKFEVACECCDCFFCFSRNLRNRHVLACVRNLLACSASISAIGSVPAHSTRDQLLLPRALSETMGARRRRKIKWRENGGACHVYRINVTRNLPWR